MIYLAVTSALRTCWRRTKAFGLPVGKYIVVSVLGLFFILTTFSLTSPGNRFLFYKPYFLAKRHAVLSFLHQQSGRQLVFVRYGQRHDPTEIWTFNKADIDASTIVWVDDMTPEENQHVLDYYGGKRKVWMLDDNAELTLRTYGDMTGKPLIDIKSPPLTPILPK
jgi:hypothetical protein